MGRRPIEKPMITCKQCNKEFAGKKEAIYCSADCRDASRRMKTECKCKRCSKVFMPKKLDRTEFCTRACFYRLMRMRKLSKAHIEKTECPAPTKVCTECHSSFVSVNENQKYCNNTQCVKKRRCKYMFLRSSMTSKDGTRQCRICNCRFTYYHMHDSDVCNSINCVSARRQEVITNRRESRSANKHKRKALKLGQRVGVIYRKEVFLRDGYRCQLCKRKTRPDYHFNHPLYPNLDHIVPLARGGAHAMTNLQCLCRECNCLKSDNLTPDQLRLFG